MKLATMLYGIVIICLVPISVMAGTIRYKGVNTVDKFIIDAAEVYTVSTLEMNTDPELSSETCVIQKLCDLAGIEGELAPALLNSGIVSTFFGKNAVAIIVHANNPVTNLTFEQLKGIFTGKIENWSMVGGPHLPIKPMVVKRTSATRKIFTEVILKHEDYQKVRIITPATKLVSKVSQEPGAIGQVSFALLLGRTGVKALTIEGQPPRVDNPNYPITQNLYFIMPTQPQGEVKAFLDWVLSPLGQKLVKRRFIGIR